MTKGLSVSQEQLVEAVHETIVGEDGCERIPLLREKTPLGTNCWNRATESEEEYCTRARTKGADCLDN